MAFEDDQHLLSYAGGASNTLLRDGVLVGRPPGPPPKRPPGTTPALPSQRITQSPSLSTDVPRLPNEMQCAGRNYQTTEDPHISGTKETKRRYESNPRHTPVDPRSVHKHHLKPPRWSRMRVRNNLEVLEYSFDKYSVGPPPAREIVISGLSPLTTPASVLQQCRLYASVEASELKVDPQTGESIGIMWVCFASNARMEAADAAASAKRAMDGQRFGPASAIHVELDHERKSYIRQYRSLLKERYEKKQQERAQVRKERRERELREHEQRRQRERRERERQAREARQASSRSTDFIPKKDNMPASIARHLAALGNSYIFVPHLPSNPLDAHAIRAHFASFAPVVVEQDHNGWYIGFDGHDTAPRCKMVLETGTLHGHRLHLEVRELACLPNSASRDTTSPAVELENSTTITSTKTSWTVDELLREATMRIMSEFKAMFLRDIKTRTVTPMVTQYLRADGKGGVLLANYKSQSMTRSASHFNIIPTVRRLDSIPKRASVDQKGEVLGPVPVPAKPHEQLDPLASGLVQDDEEAYYLEQILQGNLQTASEMAEEAHEAGSARAQGFYRIPAAEKAVHLADRNCASVTEANASHSLASARNSRADSRRLAIDIEQHRRETLADTDILNINQLQTRKKQLRFAKSPIHDWGLYAMEQISPGDMIIEYVGEIVRQQVADHREKMYERAVRINVLLMYIRAISAPIYFVWMMMLLLMRPGKAILLA